MTYSTRYALVREQQLDRLRMLSYHESQRVAEHAILCDALSHLWGIRITKVVRREVIYERRVYIDIVALGGAVCSVPVTARRLLSQQGMRGALADTLGVVIREMYTGDWHTVIRSLLQLATYVRVTRDTALDYGPQWGDLLIEFLDATDIPENLDRDSERAAVRDRRAFADALYVQFTLGQFHDWLIAMHPDLGTRHSAKTLGALLRGVGVEPYTRWIGPVRGATDRSSTTTTYRRVAHLQVASLRREMEERKAARAAQTSTDEAR